VFICFSKATGATKSCSKTEWKLPETFLILTRNAHILPQGFTKAIHTSHESLEQLFLLTAARGLRKNWENPKLLCKEK
jgi:hypothetical protein